MANSIFNINPAFIDRDFQLDAKIPGFFGSIDDPAERSAAPSFSSDWLIPKSEWKDRIEYLEEKRLALPYYRLHWNNQAPMSSCVHNAAEVVQDVMRNKQLGPQYAVKKSPMSSYCRVTTRSGSGSTMWGALQILKAGVIGNGQLPEDNPRNRAIFGDMCVHQNKPFIPNNGRGTFKDGWEKIARWFTVVEWYAIESYEQFVSALIRGWGVCYGRSGHSIAGMQAVWKDNQAICKYMDSYGHGRGDNGFLYDSPRMMNTGGAWCCREVTLPPNLAKPWEPCGAEDGVTILTREKFLQLDGLGVAV